MKMLRSDARQDDTHLLKNLNSLSIDTITLLQRDIEPYDMISLIFLLYDVPDTALQRLTIYQRVSKDIRANDTNLLLDWALHAQSRPTWRKEFLEALVTCQLFSIIRKLGLDVSFTIRYYQCSSEETSLINPIKKILYRLCETMTADNFYKLKKTLITYDIDTTDHEICELVLLELMCQKFITINQNNPSKVCVDNLTKIIDNFPTLKHFSEQLRSADNIFLKKSELNQPIPSSTPVLAESDKTYEGNVEKQYMEDFMDVFDTFNKLNLDEVPAPNLKSDTKKWSEDAYQIINPKNVGVCYIINQEKFHPSKVSIEGKEHSKPLEDRHGSTKDKEVLKKTMTNLNFEVITHDNLDHKKMFDNIKDIVKYRVSNEHSMFMLCILSHGTKGHVYAADSVKIKVEDIETLLDSDEAIHLRGKPKIMILQACQVEDNDSTYTPLVADNPKGKFVYYIKKSDVIIYWATAPNYEAYRHEKMGSIFIQLLSQTIQHYCKKDHAGDIFTKVNYIVKKVCVRLERDQLPKVEHTLDKKLYLQIPEL